MALVATQNDLLQRREIIDALDLPPDATTLDCARGRAEYVKKRATDDFKKDGLEERAFPVFVTSALEFQKLRGLRDDEPQVFDHVRDTDIPQLREFLAIAAAQEKDQPKAGSLVLQSMLGETLLAPDKTPEHVPDKRKRDPLRDMMMNAQNTTTAAKKLKKWMIPNPNPEIIDLT